MPDPPRPKSSKVTIKDVVAGLAHMELWAKELRTALTKIDGSTELKFTPSSTILSAPRVSDGLCPPPTPDGPPRRPVPKKPKPPGRGPKKK